MQRDLTRRAVGPVAVAAIVFAVGLDAIGVYADGSGSDSHGTREFLIVAAIVAIAAAAVFGWVVPRLLEREAAGGPALALSVLGLLSVLVFWTGLPPVLAGAGALLGWAGRDASRGAALCKAAMVVGVLALVADVVIFALDLTS